MPQLDPRPPVCDLDGDLIASVLVRFPIVAAQAGHMRPTYTALDYCSFLSTPEARFVRDVLTLSTDELCDRWYGGRMQALHGLARQTHQQVARWLKVPPAPGWGLDEEPRGTSRSVAYRRMRRVARRWHTDRIDAQRDQTQEGR